MEFLIGMICTCSNTTSTRSWGSAFLENEIQNVLSFCHNQACGVHSKMCCITDFTSLVFQRYCRFLKELCSMSTNWQNHKAEHDAIATYPWTWDIWYIRDWFYGSIIQLIWKPAYTCFYGLYFQMGWDNCYKVEWQQSFFQVLKREYFFHDLAPLVLSLVTMKPISKVGHSRC